MPVNYTTTTLAQARNQLALRLLDSGNVYWSVTELNSYLIAALRTTQALTSFYRQAYSFTLSPSVPFYDLTTTTFNGLVPTTDNPFGYMVTDTQLTTQILLMLLEPPTLPYTGSSQFTLTQITQALQSRINQFLLDTGCVVTWPQYANVTAGISQLVLPDLTLAIRRAAYVDTTPVSPLPPVITPLWRQDEFAANAFQRGWQQAPANPTSYSPSASPPETLQLIPPPINDGKVTTLTIQAGPILNPLTGVKLMVPDDFSQYVLWGALADLLSTDGQSRDYTRANYCRQRYTEGVAIASIFPAVLNGYINGIQVQSPGSVSEWDAWTPNWQNTFNTPSQISLGGRNIVAVSPVPDSNGPYSCGLDLVRNMPVPVTDDDYLQIPRDMLDPLIDYAQHLSCFKMCGQEFLNTIPLYQSYLQACARWNSRLTAMTFYRTAMEQSATRQGMEMELTTQSVSQGNPNQAVYPTVTT